MKRESRGVQPAWPGRDGGNTCVVLRVTKMTKTTSASESVCEREILNECVSV